MSKLSRAVPAITAVLVVLLFIAVSAGLCVTLAGRVEANRKRWRAVQLSQTPIELASGSSYVKLNSLSIEDWLAANTDWILVEIPIRGQRFTVKRRDDLDD